MFLLLACSDPAAELVRLEAFEATDARQTDLEAASASGPATVSGADRDWSLSVDLGDGSLAQIDVHSPGASDLAVLDGKELAVELGSAWGEPSRNVSIDDESGPAFLVQITEGGPISDLFGDTFVAYGELLGSSSLEDEYGVYAVDSYSARLQTDAGEVEVMPGQPVAVVLDGQTWRVVVHAAFEVTDYPDTMPGCGGGLSSTLSLEMLRVDTEVDRGALEPSADRRLSGEGSCG